MWLPANSEHFVREHRAAMATSGPCVLILASEDGLFPPCFLGLRRGAVQFTEQVQITKLKAYFNGIG